MKKAILPIALAVLAIIGANTASAGQISYYDEFDSHSCDEPRLYGKTNVEIKSAVDDFNDCINEYVDEYNEWHGDASSDLQVVSNSNEAAREWNEYGTGGYMDHTSWYSDLDIDGYCYEPYFTAVKPWPGSAQWQYDMYNDSVRTYNNALNEYNECKYDNVVEYVNDTITDYNTIKDEMSDAYDNVQDAIDDFIKTYPYN